MKENEESRTPTFWPEPQGEKSGAIYWAKKTTSLGLGKNQYFYFGQVKFEIPMKYLSEEITQAVGCLTVAIKGTNQDYFW